MESLTWKLLSSLNGWERLAAIIFSFGVVWVVARLRNLASSADVEKVTQAVESIKADHARELEAIKTSLATQLHVSQTRYTKQYDLLFELSEKVADLRTLAHQMGTSKHLGQNDQFAEDREMFKSLASELNHLLQRRRPFLPEKIYEKSSVLRARLVTNAISISNPSSESQAVRDYFEQLEKIIPLADELLDEVRACVASWQETSKYISPSSPSEGF